VILPDKNEKDLEDVSAAVQEVLAFKFVSEIEQILDIVFGPALHERARKMAESASVGDRPERRSAESEEESDDERSGTSIPAPTEA